MRLLAWSTFEQTTVTRLIAEIVSPTISRMADSRGGLSLAALRNGLFTHEDTANMHKTLGIPCLVHFLWRTLSVPFRPFDDMGFDASNLTLLLIVWHFLLSVSSLIFKIPKVRIKEGSRIWPEFRLHSIVFATRSLACMTVVWMERKFALEPMYWANAAIVMATLVAADVSTASVTHHSNTIRGLDTSAAYKFAFSFMQFLGTTGCLVGLRSFAAQFAIVFIIQTYAFTLTLRRKNLVTHRQTVFIYSYQLSLGATVAQIEIFQAGGLQALCMFPALAALALLLRVGAGLSKYIVWLVMAVVVQFARRTTPIVPREQQIDVPEWLWPAAAAAMLASAYGLFALRTAQRAAARAASADGDAKRDDAALAKGAKGGSGTDGLMLYAFAALLVMLAIAIHITETDVSALTESAKELFAPVTELLAPAAPLPPPAPKKLFGFIKLG